MLLFSECSVVVAAALNLLLLSTLVLSVQQAALFRRFTFAPNGVCVRPEIFYASASIAERKGVDAGKVVSSSAAFKAAAAAAENSYVAAADDTTNAAAAVTDNSIGKEFTLRNVPGEGDCMFLAVALATATSMGLGGNDALLRAIAAETRSVVARVLAGSGNLHIEGKRLVPARELLRSAARGEGVPPETYLRRLLTGGKVGGLQGGGPELTVLSNVLRRPISIYELDEDDGVDGDDEDENDDGIKESDSTYSREIEPSLPIGNPGPGWKRCRIKEVGVFGDMFKDPCLTMPDSAVLSGLQPGAYSWHLHILVVDAGNGEKHACVLLPQFCDEP